MFVRAVEAVSTFKESVIAKLESPSYKITAVGVLWLNCASFHMQMTFNDPRKRSLAARQLTTWGQCLHTSVTVI